MININREFCMIDGYKIMHKSIEFLHTRNKILYLKNCSKIFYKYLHLKMYTIKIQDI